MRKRLFMSTAVIAVTACLIGGTALQASAKARPAKTQRVVGAGSDTTYFLMQKLDDLYNGSLGCVVVGSPQKFDGSCYPDSPETVASENYYHDAVLELYPTGSSNGITQLANQGQKNVTAVNFARSSRGPRTTDLTGLRFVAYARDGLSWWTASTNTHTPGTNNMSQATIQGIFNTCSITQWNQVPGGSGANAILVYAAQNGSGTRATFDGFLGTGANSTNCIPANQKDGNLNNGERVVFENNAQPIYDQVEDATAIFYYSYGRFQQNGGQDGTLGKIDNVAPTKTTIQNGTFPYGRYLYNVYRATTTKTKVNAWSLKYVGEKGWICRGGAHATNPFTGNDYRTDIEAVISSEGFVPLDSGPIGGGITGNAYCRVITA